MKKIKFSHRYFKLGAGVGQFAYRVNDVRLLDALNIKLEDLSEEFLSYDTTYIRGNKDGTVETGRYDLPKKGNYIMLIFVNDLNFLFTTLRRWTPEKEKYYRGAIGEKFEVEINELNQNNEYSLRHNDDGSTDMEKMK